MGSSFFGTSSVAQPKKSEEVTGQGHRGSSGGSSAGPASDEARLIAELSRRQQLATRPTEVRLDAAGAVSRIPLQTPAQHDTQRELAECLVAEMRGRIADPKQRDNPLVSFAWAIVEGRVPKDALYRALDGLDRCRAAGKLTCPASAYFAICQERIFSRYGIDRPRKPR